MKGTESDDLRKSIVTWVREGMSNRLNNLRESVIVIIMQRLHMEDVSGAIMEHHGDEYAQLIIPMEYEPGRHFTHLAGWADPRTYEGELAWPERYAAREMASFKRYAYLWAGQYQQRPAPRGGGILKEDFWQIYEVPKSRSYEFTPIFALASLDTAFKEKEANDYSALTIWYVYDDPRTKNRRVMLADAWKKRLPLHGQRVERRPEESNDAYVMRASPKWGLLEWVEFTCTRRKVHRLIIEDASRGHDVQNEIRRVYQSRNWRTELVPPVGDKWSRASSVVDVFADDMVVAPGEWICTTHGRPHCNQCAADQQMWQWRDFAKMVIDECSVFPRGAHDDVVDSSTMALRHLRDCGYLIRRDERALAEQLAAQYQSPLPPLYAV